MNQDILKTLSEKDLQRLNTLLWLGIPKAKREGVRYWDIADGAMSVDHVSLVAFGDIPDIGGTMLIFRNDTGERTPWRPIIVNDPVSIKVSTKHLREILDQVPDDTVEISFSTRSPMIIRSDFAGLKMTAMIAPRIDNE